MRESFERSISPGKAISFAAFLALLVSAGELDAKTAESLKHSSDYTAIDQALAGKPFHITRTENKTNITYTEKKDTLQEGGHKYTAIIEYANGKPIQYNFIDDDTVNHIETKIVDGGTSTNNSRDTLRFTDVDRNILSPDSIIGSREEVVPTNRTKMEITSPDGKPDRIIITHNGKRVFLSNENGKWQAEGWDQVMTTEKTSSNIEELVKRVTENKYIPIRLKFEQRGSKIQYTGPERASNQ